ncbi:MAG: YfhO family protein [Acidobacteria bacterium]|nr:YfhO family protein [Acidobacteriota bacterium]
MSFVAYLGGGALLGVLMRWWRPRPGWAWIAGYWLLAGVFFAAPLTTSALQTPTDIAYQWRPWRETAAAPVVPANGLLSDIPLQIIPFRALARERLLHLEAPLWANEMGTGQPLLGNAQSAPFSPLGLLALPLPAVRSLPVVAALKILLSLLLTDALLAALGAGRAGACFGALAFAFSLYSVCWAYYPLGVAAAWLPGVVLGLVLLRRGERGGLAGLTACATGMALSGHPETLAHAALAAAVVAAALLAGGGGGRAAGAARWRYLRGLTAAAAISAGLAAPALLPVVEALPETVRAQLLDRTSRGVQPPAFAAATLQLAIDPLAYGSPRDGNWTGPLNFNELSTGYAGLLALALAVAAAATLGGRVLAILAAGAAALAAAFGVPPFLALVRALPLLDHVASGRLRLLWVLAVAVAAGLGLGPLTARRRGRWTAGICAVAAALGLAAEGWPQAPWQRAWWLAAVGGGALTAAACCWAAARRDKGGGEDGGGGEKGGGGESGAGGEDSGGSESGESGRGAAAWLPWLAVGCLALDLALAGGRYLPVLPARYDLAPPPAVSVMATEMRAAAAAGAPFRVVAEGEALYPNLAALYGLWDPRANDPMQPARATLVAGRVVEGRYRIGQPMLLMSRPYPVPFLGYLGVRYMLTRHRAELFPPWEEAWDGEGGKLWRNPLALPLFFMPASWRPAADSRDALLATVANEDFAAAAVAEAAETGGPREPGATAAAASGAGWAGSAGAAVPAGVHGQAGQIRLRRVRANGFELDCGSPTGGLVVSSVTAGGGWRLALDGRRAALLRVNAGFLGFLLPPGTHRATLEYRPAGWVWGVRWCALTIAAVLAALAARAATIVARRRRELHRAFTPS